MTLLLPTPCSSKAKLKRKKDREPSKKPRSRIDLIFDVLPFGRLWYGGPNAASNGLGYALHYSRSRDAMIRVADEAGNVIETQFAC